MQDLSEGDLRSFTITTSSSDNGLTDAHNFEIMLNYKYSVFVVCIVLQWI